MSNTCFEQTLQHMFEGCGGKGVTTCPSKLHNLSSLSDSIAEILVVNAVAVNKGR